MDIELPEYVLYLIKKLENAGYETYVVGGCVRDTIMKKVPNDYDICTEAEPEEIKRIFSQFKIVDTGIKYGTVTVIQDGKGVEITPFKRETQYSDGRHPDSVIFTRNFEEDLSRRDFTMNSVAYSPTKGIIDIFGGIKDINNRIIRCIGDPVKRLNQDYLRIMRTVRFASSTGFEIEQETASAMFEYKGKLELISNERIAEELRKTVCGFNFEKVFSDYREIFISVVPELGPCFGYNQNNPHHSFDLGTHIAKAVKASPDNYIIKLAALFHDIGKPSVMSHDEDGISHYYGHARVSAGISENILRRLRFSNSEILKITTLIRYHDGVIDETEKAVKRLINRLGEDMFFDLISLQRADNAAQTEDPDLRKEHYERLYGIARDVLSKSECLSIGSLAVNGYDMMSVGLVGKDIGDALSFLLDAVLNGDTVNEKGSLLDYLRKNRL